MSELIAWLTPKARKQHRCNYCNLYIPVGEKYIHQTLNNDGLYVWKCHISCDQLADTMFSDFGDGLSQDDFITGVKEEFRELKGYTDYQPINESFCVQLAEIKNKYKIDVPGR